MAIVWATRALSLSLVNRSALLPYTINMAARPYTYQPKNKNYRTKKIIFEANGKSDEREQKKKIHTRIKLRIKQRNGNLSIEEEKKILWKTELSWKCGRNQKKKTVMCSSSSSSHIYTNRQIVTYTLDKNQHIQFENSVCLSLVRSFSLCA